MVHLRNTCGDVTRVRLSFTTALPAAFSGFLIFVSVMTAFSAQGQPMPALAPEEREEWAAVGRVNTSGFKQLGLCTGTLIAPDLVLTAAHCVRTTLLGRARYFVAGWDKGTFVAHRQIKTVTRHPNYIVDDQPNVAYDIALLTLATPIPREEVLPIPISMGPRSTPTVGLILGYHKRRPHVLNGRRDCPIHKVSDRNIWIIDCEVISGNSGGPVLQDGGDGWSVVAILVARLNGGTQAIAVPVKSWVRRHWLDALARARGRSESRD